MPIPCISTIEVVTLTRVGGREGRQREGRRERGREGRREGGKECRREGG